MQNQFNDSDKILSIGVTLLLSISLLSCNNQKEEKTEAIEEDPIVEIITENMDFQLPDTIPQGWNKFHYINKSDQTHFFLVEKYPEGKTIADAKLEVLPPFANGMRLLNEGKMDEALAEFGKLPEWYGAVEFVGGSGLVSPENTAETTIKLEPGYYLIECYVKMENGEFHTTMGMLEPLVVSQDTSGIIPPENFIPINISGENGIVLNDSITAGTQTFGVYFQDQKVYENVVGHDVNLVKLNENANLDSLEKWMNWMDPKGLIDPAPEGVVFLGGVNDMPPLTMGYFTAALTPGDYVLISEVPNASEKKLLKMFTIY